MSPKIKSILLFTAAAFLLLLYFFFDARKGGFPPCPFYKLTSLLCPGCGSQRGLSALLHGDVIEAFYLNPLLIAALPILFYALAVFIKTGGKQRPAILYHPAFPKATLWVVLVFWVVRNVWLHI